MRSLFISLLILSNVTLSAQWNNNPSTNNPVCNFASNQTLVQMVSDGAGGAVCTWVDTRNGTQDIYAQRIDANGTLLWNVDGIAICNATSDQFSPRLVSDGSNGAIIAWYDNRSGNYDIYAQRINASGLVQWTVDGVAICTVAGNQNAQQLVGDGSGGAVITWSDGRVGSPNADIYAQRINASGSVLWTSNGVSICNASSLQNIPQLISDGSGGAIIVWEDWRNFSQSDVYAQRISFNGFTSWSFNGVIICTETNGHQYNTRIVSDGSGGAIMCWQDNRNFSSNTDIYAQRVNSSGLVQWTNDGLAVCTANGIQLSEQMIADGSGGAIISWEDRRTERDIYSQRISGAGAMQWTANGIPVCNASGIQEEPQLIAQPAGGAIFLWTDSRNGSQQDIYAQRMNAAGTAAWAGNGVPVANESHSQSAAQLVADGTGAAIIAWVDLRTTFDYDVYSSKLFTNGTLPLRLLTFSAVKSSNDVLLTWETDNEINTSHFDIEFSRDGSAFTKLGEVRANNRSGHNYYSFKHFSPIGSVIFYRLKQVDIDDRSEYSKIVRVDIDKTLQPLLYPNPATTILQLKNASPDQVQSLTVISIDGRSLLTWKPNTAMQFDVSSLNPGVYILRLTRIDNTITAIQFEIK